MILAMTYVIKILLIFALNNMHQNVGFKVDADIGLAAQFLVTVNDTWDPSGCIETVKTPEIRSGIVSDSFSVGSCDHGPLKFSIRSGERGFKYSIDVLFRSSVIEDASPPTCTIYWNGSYLVPTKEDAIESVLPSCFAMDSREGYHMTYYWFYLLSWTFL